MFDYRNVLGALFLCGVGLSACGPESSQRPIPLFNPQSRLFFDAPWPSDARVDITTGAPILQGSETSDGYPNPGNTTLLQNYIDVMQTQIGFGTNAPTYFRFGAPLPNVVALSAEASLELNAPIRLVNVDPYSPNVGQRIPVKLEFFEDAQRFTPSNLLAVAPFPGFPLEPKTKYAVIVTTDIAQRSREFAGVWQSEHPQFDVYRPLRDALLFENLVPEDVAVATVFTTTDPTADMARMSQYIKENIDTPILDQELLLADDFGFYDVYTGYYAGPLFQHGDRPYSAVEDGGGFVFSEEGIPVIAQWELMRIAVTVPNNLHEQDTPDGGWPVVIYQHGTGGSYRSIGSRNKAMQVGAKLAEAGMIGIGIDQPLHGKRMTPDTSDIHRFNFLNPASALGGFRQGALDAIYLVQALTERQVIFSAEATNDSGTMTIPLNPNKVLFMGHSQGGLTGSIALPWLGDKIQGAVISGAGGGLFTTLIERKVPIDLKFTIESLLLMEDEDLTELHPITGLIQHIVEPTDPINYAPFWFKNSGHWTQRSNSVLLTSGKNDSMTPHTTAEALAAAAGLGILSPAMNSPVSHALQDLGEYTAPVQDNLSGYEGNPVTGALSQWPDGDHFVVFDIPDAAIMYRDFLRGAADGAPIIDNAQ